MKDHHPKEETLEALADKLKLTKGCIRIWFFEKRHQMKLKWLSKDIMTWEMYSYHLTLRETSRKNPKKSSQNDPGLSEASEALKNLTLSSGYQRRDGVSSDFKLPRVGSFC